jgi:glycosyltransferase involved in cell wall biosynthesis
VELGEIVIFTQRSNLAFAGLHKIQDLLEVESSGLVPDSTLLVLASLPSLDVSQKNELSQLIENHQNIIFWCYGDLIWNIPFWHSLEKQLQGKKVLWVVASERWKKLAEFFIPSQNLVVREHPLERQATNPGLREVFRQKLGVKENEKLLFYAGRKNIHKNLPWLVKAWREIVDNSSDPVKLAVAGPWCDYGAGQSLEKLQKTWKNLDELFSQDLLDLGALTPQEVTGILHASDVAISMSTFLEEDYGLFLREARAIGTPIVATNWGGHADLQDAGSFLVDVKLKDSSLVLDHIHAGIQIRKALSFQSRSHLYGHQKLDLKNVPVVSFHGFQARQASDLSQAIWQSIMMGS